MTRFRVFLNRLVSLFGDGRREEELRQEIETHLAMLADDFRQRGVSDDQARAAARRLFGRVERVRDEHRDQRRLPSLDSLLQDLRFAARLLLKDRSITLASVALLTIGIGSTVVMADMLDRLLIRAPASIANPDRVRRIYTVS